ncbi:hypothetical protein [Streptomyces sp. NPDC007264]
MRTAQPMLESQSIVSTALGYHDKTATRPVTEAGGTRSRYAPGDHQR